MTTIDLLEKTDNEITIISGEGEGPGTVEYFHGRRTLAAIKRRLTKERCGGDRWARATIFSHKAAGESVYIDILSGEYC
jgi:hypothetical protein